MNFYYLQPCQYWTGCQELGRESLFGYWLYSHYKDVVASSWQYCAFCAFPFSTLLWCIHTNCCLSRRCLCLFCNYSSVGVWHCVVLNNVMWYCFKNICTMEIIYRLRFKITAAQYFHPGFSIVSFMHLYFGTITNILTTLSYWWLDCLPQLFLPKHPGENPD